MKRTPLRRRAASSAGRLTESILRTAPRGWAVAATRSASCRYVDGAATPPAIAATWICSPTWSRRAGASSRMQSGMWALPGYRRGFEDSRQLPCGTEKS